MDTNRGKEGREQDNTEVEPQWPQRPARPQPPAAHPRLDPPVGRTPSAPQDSGAGLGERPQPALEDDPKETRMLPVIEPSRFERGSQTRPTPRDRAPQAQPQPQAQAQTRPPQPQVRKQGGWQYEREDHANERTGRPHPAEEDQVQPHEPAQYVVPTTQGPRPHSRASASPNRGYLAVNVEGASSRGRLRWLVWTLVAVFAVVLIGATAFSLAWQGQYAGKVYAGVSALDTDLGGKTPDAAKKLLGDKLEGFVSQPFTLTWQGKEWRPSADQLGIKVDVDATVDEAYRVGRGSDPFSSVSQQWDSAQAGYSVPLVVQISEPDLQRYLAGLAESEINQELFDGDVRLNGTEVVALPGKEGRTLRTYEAIAAIRDAAAKLEQSTIKLPVEIVQPSVSAQEVQYIEGLLAVRVSGPITATAPGGKTMTLDRQALVNFTTIERNPDRSAPHHIELGWIDRELNILGDRWASEVNRPAQNARFAWNNGALSVLNEAVEGFETNSAAIIASIKEHSGTSNTREYALPGKVITPTVASKDLGALGIKELMGTGTSTFKGSSAERATNIRVAANLLNGAVVPPGGTFSFLQTMGGIDEVRGFVEGYVIAAERTQKGVGGGVCQVSTTTFRAAFWSGLKITERNQHLYRVGWYEANGEPVGFDAAVFDPGVDLKFVNDTPGYVLVEAKVSPDTLTVNLYGTKRPGQVKLEGPAISNRVPPPSDVYQVDERLPAGSKKQVETAHGGLDTLVTRRIVTPGQPDKVDQFHSSYKAWPNWYIVASGSQVPGGVPPTAVPQPTPKP